MTHEAYLKPFETLFGLLKARNLHVAAAESCTAGLFSATLAEIPGASDVMEYGFIVYSVDAKDKLVGVSRRTVDAFGVVSEETAIEMALGAAERAGAEIGVGITGFAGPGSDGVLPVGRVCFGYRVFGKTFAETVDFGDRGRNEVRRLAAFRAAQRLTLLLRENACD